MKSSTFITAKTTSLETAVRIFKANYHRYNLLHVLTERQFCNMLVYLVPAQSRSLPKFCGDKSLQDFLTKLWREVLNGIGKLAVAWLFGSHLGVYTFADTSSIGKNSGTLFVYTSAGISSSKYFPRILITDITASLVPRCYPFFFVLLPYCLRNTHTHTHARTHTHTHTHTCMMRVLDTAVINL